MPRLIVACLLLGLFLISCAEIQSPSPDKILMPWNESNPVQLGQSKDSVREGWGEPDEIRQLGADEIGLIKEEWVYHGRYPDIPVDQKYLSKTKRLLFTGDSLTGYQADETYHKIMVKEK